MYGPVDTPDDRATRTTVPTGRHRGRQPMQAAAALGLSVVGLVAAFGLGSALLPASLTGPGTPAELPAAAVAALAPGAGGGAPGDRAARSAGPSAPPSASSPTRTAAPRAELNSTKQPKPKATPKKTTAVEVGPGMAGQESEVIRLVNIERGRAGCRSVQLNTKLRTAIRLHVQELGTHDDLYISHVSDDGRTFVDRAKAQWYTDPGGENVARGQRDAADVMDSWMKSAGHRANILNCTFKSIGVGATKGVDGSVVWGQLFGRS